MTTSRMLVLMVLVVATTLTPIATSVAHASIFDDAYKFAYDLCQYYWSCDEPV
jgi:hypothetical protein